MIKRSFGKYRILAPLAQGGMARVFKALVQQDDGSETLVALKRIRKEFAEDEEFVERFMDEACIASTFAHDNIVKVTDFGSVEGEPFLAMELVEGLDLRVFIQKHRVMRTPVPLWAVLYIATRIARGLEAAHCRLDALHQPAPVIHRDISPQNILLSWDGQVKIADFGVAKAAEKVLRTRTGVILGKWRYMAPEQASGASVDCRADVFSAGCVMHELLTGRPLFEGQGSEQILQNILNQAIPSIAGSREDVPPALQEIYRRSLSRPLEQRYNHAGELAADLSRCLKQVAPEASRKRFSELIRSLETPQVVERGNGATLALAETVESESSEKPTTIKYPQPKEPETLESESSEQPTAVKYPQLPEQETAVAAPQTLLARQTTVLLDHPASLPPRRRRWSLSLIMKVLLIAWLGLMGGALAGLAGHRRGATEVTLGQKIEHAGWTLHVDRIEPVTHPGGGVYLGLELRLQHASETVDSLGNFFVREQGRHLTRPLFCTRAGGAKSHWKLFFQGKKEPKLVLRFRPRGAPALRLRIK